MSEAESNLAERPASQLAARPAPPARPVSYYQNEEDEDTILPRIHVFQGLPAEAKKYGKLDLGAMVNTVTSEVITATRFIVIFGYSQWIKWKEPRGSGFDYNTRVASEVPPADLMWDRVNGRKPAAQKYMNFVVLFEGMPSPIILSFKSKGIVVGKTILNTDKLRGARGRGLHEISFVEETNDKGTWMQPKVKLVGDPPPEMMAVAEELVSMLAGKTIESDIDKSDYDPTRDEE